ncbi:TlpA family protein disulfide reductase [Pseudonocardia hispaniensis]|uniref:TlpA family protein disulfide reductase n=1 Tax=Pseudonocardia hispaniensis TaxID=904933 RepID=A0ABW1IZT4_9PSEU
MIRLLTLVTTLLLLAGCATAGKDAVAVGGEFQFVAPGGQTEIRYDPPESRGTLPQLAGESLLHPGRTIGVGDHTGKVLVINIWGSWCGPCREEMPDLEFVLDQTRADGVALMGIDVRDDRAAATDFVRDRGLSFDSMYDPPGRVLAALSGYPRNTVPSTIVLDRQHRVAAVYLTTIRVAELIPLVKRLAAEPSG